MAVIGSSEWRGLLTGCSPVRAILAAEVHFKTTTASGCGMWERASSSRSSRATGDCILPSVACYPRSSFFFWGLPRSPGERRRRPVHNVINVVTNLHPKYSSQHQNSGINNVRFSLDGTMLASCSGGYNQNDNSVSVWNVGTGEQLKKLEGHR